MAVAFFDMDGTLIDGDTNEISQTYLIEKGLCAPNRLEELRDYGRRFFEGDLDINSFIAFAVAPLAGLPAARLQSLVSDCVTTRILPRVKPGAVKEIARQREQGNTTFIVTSTVDYIVEPIRDGLGIDCMIAAPMERVNGVLTGRQAGPVPYQDGKVTLIRRFLRDKGLSLAGSSAYGDSVNDLPMLRLCEHRFAVDPNEKLRAHPDFKQLVCLSWK